MQLLTREQFLQTDVGTSAVKELQRMTSSADYTTIKAYDPCVGHKQSFVDRHINYLVKHPHVSPLHYLSNLRVMTKVKR